MRPAPRRFSFRLPRLAPRTAAVAGLALVSAVVTHQVTSDASAARAALGATTEVVVATAPIEPGTPVTSANTAVEARPAVHVPPGALAGTDGRAARHAIGPGEIVTDADVRADHATGPAALLPEGWRGVAVESYGAVPPLDVGDVVDVHATVDPLLAEAGTAPTGVLVESAVVIAVDDDAITVAVPADRVDRLALARTLATVTLVLRA